MTADTPCPGCPAVFGSSEAQSRAWWEHVAAEHPAVAARLRAAIRAGQERERPPDWSTRHQDGVAGGRAAVRTVGPLA